MDLNNDNQEFPVIRSWRDLIVHLMGRYGQMLETHGPAISARLGPDIHARAEQLCRHAIEHVSEIPEDKANRWLGFIQGILVGAGVMDIEDERDHTRPLFHGVKGPMPTHDARFPRRPTG